MTAFHIAVVKYQLKHSQEDLVWLTVLEGTDHHGADRSSLVHGREILQCDLFTPWQIQKKRASAIFRSRYDIYGVPPVTHFC